MSEVNHRCPYCLTLYKVDREDPEACPDCGREITPEEINHGALVTGPASYSEGNDE
jgi:hypothetical protein